MDSNMEKKTKGVTRRALVGGSTAIIVGDLVSKLVVTPVTANRIEKLGIIPYKPLMNKEISPKEFRFYGNFHRLDTVAENLDDYIKIIGESESIVIEGGIMNSPGGDIYIWDQLQMKENIHLMRLSDFELKKYIQDLNLKIPKSDILLEIIGGLEYCPYLPQELERKLYMLIQ